jgi:hypothetical protein
MAANLPSRSVRQAYDYVVSEGSPEYYEEFIRLYPNDPLCDDIRVLLYNLKVAKAWHKAVLANSPFAYKTFHENYSNSLYAPAALKLYGAPKAVPLMQFTHLAKVAVCTSTATSDTRSPIGGAWRQHMPVVEGRNRSAKAYGKMGTIRQPERHSFNAGKSRGNRQVLENVGQDEQQSNARRQQAHVQQRPRHFGGGWGRSSASASPRAVAHVVRPRSFGGGRSFGGAASGALTNRELRQTKPGRAHALPVSFETG